MRNYSIRTLNYAATGTKKAPYTMVNFMKKLPLTFGALVGALLSSTLQAAPPSAPTGLCLQSQGGTQCIENSAPAIDNSSSGVISPQKVNISNFHPGHYMRIGDSESITSINSVLDIPGFVGLKKGYSWRDLEPAEGVYDFSKIEADLDYLKSVGKQLWIVVGSTQFSSTNQPKTPAYMWQNPKYGCDPRYYGSYERTTQEGGWLPCIWNDNVLARYRALYDALGKRFNNEANFEGMNLGETSTGSTEWGYTKEKEKIAFQTRALDLKKAFPDKTVTQMINYANFNLTEYSAWLANNGVGIAGPDVHLMPEKLNLQTNIYPLYIKYHDIVPTGPDVQWDNYTRYNSLVGRANTAEELLLGAINYTDPWYIFWEKREPYFTNDVIPTIKKYGYPPAAKQFYDSRN